MKVHACFLDRECRAYGAPKQLHIDFKHAGHLTIGERTQGWLPFLGAMPWNFGPRWLRRLMWWPVVYRPKTFRKHTWLLDRYPHWYGRHVQPRAPMPDSQESAAVWRRIRELQEEE